MTTTTFSGAFRAGDRVQLTGPKGRMNSISLEPGAVFHTHKGWIEHDNLIGLPDGSVVQNSIGIEYLALRPLLTDFVMAMPRGAAIIYPKDAAQILAQADIFPGATVVEAGVGSGALSLWLLRALGDVGDLTAALPTVHDEATVDRVILDMLAPWECIEAVATALKPGGVVLCYVATVTQLSRVTETIRSTGLFTNPDPSETMVRTWHVEGLAVRPDHRMIGHTGFLVTARRLAPGSVLPELKRRASKSEYSDDDVEAWTPGALGERGISPKSLRKRVRQASASANAALAREAEDAAETEPLD